MTGPRRWIANWIVGAIVGTMLIAISSPLFVRSYLPLQPSETRGVWTLPPGGNYRWRSEGYATTHIGPLGMPGKTALGNPRRDVIRVALWGDSQAEGVCVADPKKIFAQTEQQAAGRIEVFPFARSGDDASDWQPQMPLVESALGIDVHVLLVTELSDLASAGQPLREKPADDQTRQRQARIAAVFPAFLIQAIRRVLRTAEDQPRTLRFSIGPVSPPLLNPPSPPPATDWADVTHRIRAMTTRQIVIVYAPVVPAVIGGNVVVADPDEQAFEALMAAAQSHGVTVLDLRQELRQTAAENNWPHGFHNGRFGSGHLNEVGNRLIAQQLASLIPSIADRPR